MTETEFYYPGKLFEDWKRGLIHKRWYEYYRDTFCEVDLSIVENQHVGGYHFGEWFMTLHYLHEGYEVLTEKYALPSHHQGRAKAIEILGEAGVSFLDEMYTPDLLVFKKSYPKTFFFVEVKRDHDKLETNQEKSFPKIEQKFKCQVKIARLLPRESLFP
jgi:hypothetical protein